MRRGAVNAKLNRILAIGAVTLCFSACGDTQPTENSDNHREGNTAQQQIIPPSPAVDAIMTAGFALAEDTSSYCSQGSVIETITVTIPADHEFAAEHCADTINDPAPAHRGRDCPEQNPTPVPPSKQTYSCSGGVIYGPSHDSSCARWGRPDCPYPPTPARTAQASSLQQAARLLCY